ncbi:MAG: stage III sporulation protein AG [Lachnospiraceae bacterium]|nr:stage III sporulation protein AG [Lachnospiraceae bacterium]
MKIKDFFQNKSWQKWDKSQWTILVLAGVLLMILAIPVEDEKKTDKIKSVTAQKENQTGTVGEEMNYVEEMEQKLEDTLAKIEGAGRVEVMITLEDTGESVVEKDDSLEISDVSKTDSAGGTGNEKQSKSSETTVYHEQEGGQTPFIGKEMTPKIAGILVVAQGGENTQVKQNISDAVMALFQIDVNRIKVVKMNMQEEE